MKKSTVVDIISCLFILLFLYTGIVKLVNHEYFRTALGLSPLHKYGAFIAIPIPVLEVLIALALLIPLYSNRPRLRKWGLYGSALLMAVFTVYVGWMLKYASHLPCTCGGIIQQMNWHQHFYFNTLFTLLALLGIWLNRRASIYDQNLAFS